MLDVLFPNNCVICGDYVKQNPVCKSCESDFEYTEKCDLCEACVEACKAKAMPFGDLTDPDSEVRKILSENDTIRRKPHLHTLPNVYYIIGWYYDRICITRYWKVVAAYFLSFNGYWDRIYWRSRRPLR